MSKADDIRAFIKDNPGQTTAQIAAAVEWTTGRVSAMLWAELQKTKQVIRREVEMPDDGGAPIYRYYYDDSIPVRRKVKVEAPAVVAEDPVEVVPEAEAPTETAPAPFPRFTPAPAEKHDSLAILTDALAQVVADHVNRRVEQLTAGLTQALRNMLPASPLAGSISVEQLMASLTAPPDQRTRLPKVMIAGLRPNQMGIISAEFSEVFDLEFYSMDDSLSQLRKTLVDVDHFITFTSFISHKVTDVAKANGVKINHCNGGMTMLKDMLVKLYAEGAL